jgi:hypothetical protein
MEQILEFLKANQLEMEAENKAEMMARMEADRRERKAHHEEMMAGLKRLNATADAWLGEVKAW